MAGNISRGIPAGSDVPTVRSYKRDSLLQLAEHATEMDSVGHGREMRDMALRQADVPEGQESAIARFITEGAEFTILGHRFRI